MKSYGVMLIGCGHIGMEHLMDIYYRDNIRIEAVIDKNLDKAKLAARKSGAKTYDTEYRKYLNNKEINIVIIATYTNSHLLILEECLNANKHILCEKPIALTLEEGRKFVNLVKKSSSKVLVAHILRHNRSYLKINELVKSGVIGELKLIRMIQNHHAKDWKRYCRLLEDCSPTLDCGVHYYDLAQWIADSRIIEVMGFAQKTQPDAPRENHTLVSFNMENGCKGFYEAGWGESIRACNVKEFIGTKGRITLEMLQQRSHDYEEGDLITLYHSDTNLYETINICGEYKDMYAQIHELINMIENNTEGFPSIDEIWSAFVVAQSAVKSIENNSIVRLDYNL